MKLSFKQRFDLMMINHWIKRAENGIKKLEADIQELQKKRDGFEARISHIHELRAKLDEHKAQVIARGQ